jgi:AcrR family transcriptional regulator/DNA-binding MarR family transcriptional regulator
MSEVQRARILAAAVAVVAEQGYGGMSTARVTNRAGVSRRTFYELFEGREDCFLGIFDEAVGRIVAVVRPAYEREREWREKVRAGLSALLQFIGDEPGLGTLVIVEALGAGPRVLERRARVLETLSTIVDQGRSEITGEDPLADLRSVLTAEGVVGAVFSVLFARLIEPERRPLDELLNPLTAMIVLPYLGQVPAARELARPRLETHLPPGRPMRDALDGLQMRITYRTLRVLAAIAEQPGASNRQIANAAGVSDPGQISKLLRRLERYGLIGNRGPRHFKGECNAWTLTAKGDQVQRAVQT